jgi:predicted amidohydrolase YtcJ
VLSRAGGHSATANSRALALARITAATPDPEGGVIEKDERGEPNGIIRERQDIVARLVPPSKPEDLRPSFVANLKRLLSLGITSIVEAGTVPGAYREWEAIYQANRGELPRAAVQIFPGLQKGGATVAEALGRLERFGRRTGAGDEWLRVGAVKLWIDGGYAGPAAWTLEPYPGQPSYYGIQNVDSADLATFVTAAHRAGWQLGIHAIGDAAIKLTVDVLSSVIDAAPRADHRHYLNHFTVVPPRETMRRMARRGILIAQQPNFTWAPTLESRYVENLAGDRLERNNSLRTPMGHGIFVALGSDNHPIGPLPGLYGAVTRTGASGRVYGADERLSMPEAIVGYTRNGAFLTFEEREKGTIEPGKLADLVVLSDNLLEIDPARILDAKVDLTILGGKVVYQRAGAGR